MILKTICAGPLRQQILYSNIRVQEDDTLEARRQKHEIRRQADYWMRSKHHAMAALILANFDGSALWVTLDFRPEALPPDRAKVSRRFGLLCHRLRADGRTIHYIKCMEHRHGAGRWHIHAIMDGCTAADITAAWPYGGAYVKALDPARVVPHRCPDGSISGGLARYICKELPDKPGQRTYQASTRSARLRRPEVTRQVVPDDYIISPPIGCTIIEGKILAVNPCGSSYGMAWLMPPAEGG